MRFLVRLIISLAGGITALAMLLVFLTFLVSEYTASPPQREPGSADVPTSTINGAAATDAWLGRWMGPEGTFLLLEGGNGRYEVTIQDLDGPRVFQGMAAGARIEFERDGSA